MDKIKRLKEIANIVRKDIEASNSWPSDLRGACGEASLHLLKLANAVGMYPTFHSNALHCWNTYCGYLIDITATQFITCPKVLFKKLSHQNYHNDFYWYSTFDTRSFNKAQQHIKGWYDYTQSLYLGESYHRFIENNIIKKVA